MYDRIYSDASAICYVIPPLNDMCHIHLKYVYGIYVTIHKLSLPVNVYESIVPRDYNHKTRP